MPDPNTNPKTNAVFVGALLTILANTAATITYAEIYIKIIMALAIYLLTVCLILEFSTTNNIPLAKNLKDNSETLKISYDFFIIGILMVATLIISLTFKSTTILKVPTGLIISITLLILIYVTNIIIAYKLNHKKQHKNDQRKAAGKTQTSGLDENTPDNQRYRSPYNCNIFFFRQYLSSRELSRRLTGPEATFL